MPTDAQHDAYIGLLKSQHEAHIGLLKKIADIREPIDDTVSISSTSPYVVDYRNRKHIFIWLPATQTLSIEDYGTGTVQGQVWINIGIRAGVKIAAPNVTSGSVQMMVRCTDSGEP